MRLIIITLVLCTLCQPSEAMLGWVTSWWTGDQADPGDQPDAQPGQELHVVAVDPAVGVGARSPSDDGSSSHERLNVDDEESSSEQDRPVTPDPHRENARNGYQDEDDDESSTGTEDENQLQGPGDHPNEENEACFLSSVCREAGVALANYWRRGRRQKACIILGGVLALTSIILIPTLTAGSGSDTTTSAPTSAPTAPIVDRCGFGEGTEWGWGRANENCGVPCPNGISDCPEGEGMQCWGKLTERCPAHDALDDDETTAVPAPIVPRCGWGEGTKWGWGRANENCDVPCPNGISDCPEGEGMQCWGKLTKSCGHEVLDHDETSQPTPSPGTIQDVSGVLDHLSSAAVVQALNDNVMVKTTGEPAEVFTTPGLLEAVKEHALRSDGGIWLGDGDSEQQKKYGLVNLAAFLGQTMKESIGADSCNEIHHDKSTVSPSCGQHGENYADYAKTCSNPCPAIPNATIEAKDSSTLKCEPYNGPEPPLELDPNADYPTMRCGYGWDDAVDNCHPSCDLGDNPCIGEDKDGVAYTCFKDLPKYACDPATIEPKVQDCCHWGRGSIQITGRCNTRDFDNRWGAGNPLSAYSNIDFCAEPNQICDGPRALKWLTGLDFWKTNVEGWVNDQTHPRYGGYKKRLKEWVDAGMNVNDTSFINEVSGLVNRGCPANACDGRDVDGPEDRQNNFIAALKALKLPITE